MAALRRVLVGLLVTVVLAATVVVLLVLAYDYTKTPLPLSDHCVARVQEQSVRLDTEQSHYASVIVGVSTQRGLVPRASTIALATVYQESGIRNLDHGDRDSLGLFQQRPSQGWGTPEQVQDPWYASGRFYDALVKVDNWRTGDVNDVAQAVQRSGHPNGYQRHVENARRLASSLTGETPASWTCIVRESSDADPAGLRSFLAKTLPNSSAVTRSGDMLTIKASDNRLAWSAAHIVVAHAGSYGVERVDVGAKHWTASPTALAPWLGDNDNATTVVVRFKPAPTATPGQTPTPRKG